MADPAAAVQGCGGPVGVSPVRGAAAGKDYLWGGESAPSVRGARRGHGALLETSTAQPLPWGEGAGRGNGLILILPAREQIPCGSSVAEQRFRCAGLSEQNEINRQLNKPLNEQGEGQGGGKPQ